MKDSFSSELVAKVKEANNILSVVGEHVVLKKAGTNYSGLCPFHSEKSPSFSVSEQKQLYHCYGCRAGGDLISFVKEIQGLSFPEAIVDLAERAGIEIPSDRLIKMGAAGNPHRELQTKAFRLNRFAAAFYRNQLRSVRPALEYLKQRNISDEFSKTFYLGAATSNWDDLAKHLKKSQAPLDLAERIGMIRPSKRKDLGHDYFDLLRNRVVFPIINSRGKVAGFGGRTLAADPKATNDPKYINSSESFIFDKSKILFGLYHALKHIRETGRVVLVEGFFDVIGLHRAGIPNVVATCGTAFTPQHLKILSRFTTNIIALFDGDSAGRAAMEKSMLLGMEQGLVVSGSFLPKGSDPDDLSNKGSGEELRSLVSGASPILDQYCDKQVERSKKGTEERSLAVKQVGDWLSRFQDPVGREIRIQEISAKIGVSQAVLTGAIGQLPRERQGNQNRNQSINQHAKQSDFYTAQQVSAKTSVPQTPIDNPQVQRVSIEKLTRAEWVGLVALVHWRSFLKIWSKIGDNMPLEKSIADLFEHPSAKALTTKLVENLYPGLDEHEIKGFLETSESVLNEPIEDIQVRSTITEALFSETPGVSEKDVELALTSLLRKVWARFSQRLRAALDSGEAQKDVKMQANLMKDYLDVQRKMKEFNNFHD